MPRGRSVDSSVSEIGKREGEDGRRARRGPRRARRPGRWAAGEERGQQRTVDRSGCELTQDTFALARGSDDGDGLDECAGWRYK